MRPSARLYFCLACAKQVIICQRCDRGHRYCSAACATQARQQSLYRAQRRYQKTRPGRLNNARRQQRFRDRQQTRHVPLCEPCGSNRTKVTHHGSVSSKQTVSWPHHPELTREPDAVHTNPQPLSCHCCGQPCSVHLRRHFLHSGSRSPPLLAW